MRRIKPSQKTRTMKKRLRINKRKRMKKLKKKMRKMPTPIS